MSINDKYLTEFLTSTGWQIEKKDEAIYQTAHIHFKRSTYKSQWKIMDSTFQTYTDDTKLLKKLYSKYGKQPSINLEHINFGCIQ